MRALLTALFVLISAPYADAQSRLFVSASSPAGTLTGAINLPTGRVEWAAPTPQLSHLLTTADGKYLVVPLQGSLFLVDADTKAITQVTPGVQVDGSTVIAHPRRLEFYAVLADGTLASITLQAVRTLFSCPTAISGPDISGDGRRLIVTCGQDIVVLDADTGALINRFSTGSTVDLPASNSDGSRVVVRQGFQFSWPHNNLSLYEVATGTRLVQGISPPLVTFDPGVISILAATPNRDALLVVDNWDWFGSCAHAYNERIIDFDTLAIRQTLPGEIFDRGVAGGFTADGTFAVLGWKHVVSTCGFYRAAITLFDIMSNRSVSSIDLTTVATQSLTLTLANAPLAPGNPTAQVTGNRVTLSWTEPPIASAATTHYVVEAGSAPGLNNLAVFSTQGLETSISVSNVAAGHYYVRVRAVNFTGRSDPSQEIVVDVM